MWAWNFFPDGVRGKFNMPLAEEAGRFQEIGFAQSDDSLAMRAGNFLAEVSVGKPDMDTAGRAGHF